MEHMKTVIKAFDQLLAQQNLEFSAIVVGGAALNIMDITSRVTKDVDLIDPKIPPKIKDASLEFVKTHPELSLHENWFNNGPISLIRDLDDGWRRQVKLIYKGEALELFTLGRIDLLKSKLYALCDGNPLWPERVHEMTEALKDELHKKRGE